MPKLPERFELSNRGLRNHRCPIEPRQHKAEYGIRTHHNLFTRQMLTRVRTQQNFYKQQSSSSSCHINQHICPKTANTGKTMISQIINIIKLTTGIEPVTSCLPSMRPTIRTAPAKVGTLRIELRFPAYKTGAAATGLRARVCLLCPQQESNLHFRFKRPAR